MQASINLALAKRPRFLLAVVCVVVGCGSDTGQVSIRGAVSYDGHPIDAGTIVFTPMEVTKGPSTGGRIKDGRYDVPADKGPVVGGHYRVEITALRKTGKTMANTSAEGPLTVELSEQFVPDRYNTHSTLRVVVTAGANTANFSLNSSHDREEGQQR